MSHAWEKCSAQQCKFCTSLVWLRRIFPRSSGLGGTADSNCGVLKPPELRGTARAAGGKFSLRLLYIFLVNLLCRAVLLRDSYECERGAAIEDRGRAAHEHSRRPPYVTRPLTTEPGPCRSGAPPPPVQLAYLCSPISECCS